MVPPKAAKDLRIIYDVVWINTNYIKGVETPHWKPQMSTRNCNRTQMWNLLTIHPNDKFHILERKYNTNPPKSSVFYHWTGSDFTISDFVIQKVPK